MGYTTVLKGRLKFDKALTKEQTKYIQKFCWTRRMMRDNDKLEAMPDPVRLAVGLPLGVNGEYFVGGLGEKGLQFDESCIRDNPPETQPQLWCHWTVNDKGTYLEWDGAEKFYSYVEWLEYLIKNFFSVWGINLNGKISWQGEDKKDKGKIIVVDNALTVETKYKVEDVE